MGSHDGLVASDLSEGASGEVTSRTVSVRQAREVLAEGMPERGRPWVSNAKQVRELASDERLTVAGMLVFADQRLTVPEALGGLACNPRLPHDLMRRLLESVAPPTDDWVEEFAVLVGLAGNPSAPSDVLAEVEQQAVTVLRWKQAVRVLKRVYVHPAFTDGMAADVVDGLRRKEEQSMNRVAMLLETRPDCPPCLCDTTAAWLHHNAERWAPFPNLQRLVDAITQSPAASRSALLTLALNREQRTARMAAEALTRAL